MPNLSHMEHALPVAHVEHAAPPALSPAAARVLGRTPLEDLGLWLSSCGRGGRSPAPGTRRAYLASFHAFGAWLSGSDDPVERDRAVAALVLSKNLAEPARLLRAYREELLGTGLAAATINGRLAALSSFWSWARRCGLTTFRPERLTVTPERRHDRRGPSTPEVVAMLAACGTDPVGRRDAFIIRAARNLGLRRSEIVGLRLEDIGHGELRVLGKGRRERVSVALDPATAASLAAWLEARGDAPGPLLTRFDYKAATLSALSGDAVRDIVARRARQAGIEKTVRPHGLRHCGATAVARTVGRVAALAAWGRWASLDTARAYLDDLEEQAADAAREIAV
jgi:integrase/recombinase XerC